MSKPLSLPAEHGAYITAAGAGVTAAMIAPQSLVALLVGLAVLAAFLARGVVDRLAVGKPLARWDGPWLVSLGLAASTPALVLGPREAIATLVLALGLVGASVWARRARRHRDARVEAAGMAVLGASAGWVALVAGASELDSICVGLVLGAHAGLAVPLVRTELRKRELGEAGRAELLTLGVVLGIALATAALGRPLVALALLPRAAQACVRRMRTPRMKRPPAYLVGVRESVELVLAAGALAAAL